MALDSTINATKLTAEQVLTVLVAPLAAKSVFLSSGVRIVDTAGPLRMPKGANATTPDWYGQNEQIIEDDPTFDEVSLLPSTMKSVKVLSRFSNELARQSVIALAAALRQPAGGLSPHAVGTAARTSSLLPLPEVSVYPRRPAGGRGRATWRAVSAHGAAAAAPAVAGAAVPPRGGGLEHPGRCAAPPRAPCAPPGLTADERLAWRLAMLATQRWLAAAREWLQTHRLAVLMPVEERRRWQLTERTGANPRCRWRDQVALLAALDGGT